MIAYAVYVVQWTGELGEFLRNVVMNYLSYCFIDLFNLRGILFTGSKSVGSS